MAQGQVRNIKVNNLNQDFPELIKGNFNIINSKREIDSLGHNYLIFEIVPKQKGLYTVTHTFSDIQNANSNPTITEESNTSWNIKEINYETEYVLPVYDKPIQQFYKYKDFYHHTNSPIAFNNINDTILIPFILCENCKRQEITLRKFENLGNWDKELSNLLSKENRIHVNYTNNIKELEVVHFKHIWSTMCHVADIGTPGLSSIYAVFKAKKEGEFSITIGEDVEIPIEIISKEATLKTHYGISCERTELHEKGGGIITTFHKVFAPSTVTLREGDIFNFKIQEFESRRGNKIKLDAIVFEKKNEK